MNELRYFRPNKIEEALAMLSSEGPEARALAGGTDLLVRLRAGLIQASMLVDLGHLSLGGIHLAGDALVIGSGTKMSALRRDEAVNANFPLLARAAASLGAVQIQNMASLGGNLCNASPAADGACALMALDARVLLRSARGVRSLPLGEFLRGPGQTALETGEILQSVTIPRSQERRGVVQTFGKFGIRNALACSLASVAGWTRLEEERVVESRLALGAVGATTLRAHRAEALLAGERLTDERIRTAAAAAPAECEPIDDHRARAEFRRRLVAALVREHLQECVCHV